MQITSQADYAIRCVLYLAQREGRITMAKEIARAKKIPRDFLSKILQKLTRAGLVRSYRGIKGGFELAKRPEEINLLDVIQAIDGPVAFNRCAINRRLCTLSNSCSVHPVWVEMRKEMEGRLSRINFKMLSNRF